MRCARYCNPVVVATGSVAIWMVERPQGGPVKSFSDALWWALTTVTTVRYGDMSHHRRRCTSACHPHFSISPPCTGPEWAVRQDVVWPYPNLDA
jgi:hypothetical protein